MIYESRKRKPVRRKQVKRRKSSKRRLTKGMKLAHHVKVITICVIALFSLALITMIFGENTYVKIYQDLQTNHLRP